MGRSRTASGGVESAAARDRPAGRRLGAGRHLDRPAAGRRNIGVYGLPAAPCFTKTILGKAEHQARVAERDPGRGPFEEPLPRDALDVLAPDGADPFGHPEDGRCRRRPRPCSCAMLAAMPRELPSPEYAKPLWPSPGRPRGCAPGGRSRPSRGRGRSPKPARLSRRRRLPSPPWGRSPVDDQARAGAAAAGSVAQAP